MGVTGCSSRFSAACKAPPEGLPSLPAASPWHPRKAGLRLNDPLRGMGVAPSTAPKHLKFQAQSKLIFSFIEQRETAPLNSFDTLAAALGAAGPGLRPAFELRGGKQGKGANLGSEASPRPVCMLSAPTARWRGPHGPLAVTPGRADPWDNRPAPGRGVPRGSRLSPEQLPEQPPEPAMPPLCCPCCCGREAPGKEGKRKRRQVAAVGCELRPSETCRLRASRTPPVEGGEDTSVSRAFNPPKTEPEKGAWCRQLARGDPRRQR